MKFFLGLLWLVATGCVFYFGHDHYLCRIRGLCNESEIVKESPKASEPAKIVPAVPNFEINDEGANVFVFNGSPITEKGNALLVLPDTLGALPDSISSYLNIKLNKNVHLTMYYNPEVMHENGLSDSSLTAKRMGAFVSDLKSQGVNEDKIITKLVSRLGMYADGTVYDGLEINFETLSQEKMAEVDKGITNKILYAAFGKGEFKPDRTLANYASELKDYLNRNPSAKVTVTGHTDDVGKASSNYELGLVRANNVMNYLVSRGVEKTRIKAFSKGETAPLDNSKTEKARSLNRRIEVIVN